MFPRINPESLRLNLGKFVCKLYIVQLSYGGELKNSTNIYLQVAANSNYF